MPASGSARWFVSKIKEEGQYLANLRLWRMEDGINRGNNKRIAVKAAVLQHFIRSIQLQCWYGIHEHYLKTFFAHVTVFLLTGIPVQLLFQIALTITMHFRLAPVLTKYLCNIGLLRLKLHHNKALAEVLQQKTQGDAHDEEVFHGTNLRY